MKRVAIEILDGQRSKNGVAGTKLHFHQAEDLENKVGLEALDVSKYIYIDRSDLEMQAVSLAKAWQTRQFSSKHMRQAEAAYSFEMVLKALQTLKREKKEWISKLAQQNVDYCETSYEAILVSPDQEIEKILKYLGVGKGRPVDVSKMKIAQQRDEDSLRWRDMFLADKRLYSSSG